ncbi:MAG: protein kinase [Planctomycetales bacterium]|nr:protein kinase [Planctomycetales bacterium]
MKPMANARRQYECGDEAVPGYRLIERLGSGGLGEVWKAQAAGGAHVALKIVSGLRETSALKELRALELVKNIHHPNLVPIHGIWLKNEHGEVLPDDWFATETGSGRVKVKVRRDNASSTTLFGEPGSSSDPAATDDASPDLGETRSAASASAAHHREPNSTVGPKSDSLADQGEFEAELILAMGLADENLFDRLTRCKQAGLAGLPQDELLGYLDDAARAIDLMNTDYDIQHGDIKPKNMLLVGGSVQVCDFGLAEVLRPLRQTRSSAFTVAYAAPEVVSLRQPSRHTDQYCLAISYYELRTGELPFESTTAKGVIKEKQTGKLKLDRLPSAERRVVARAAALLPEARYPSCAEMLQALRRAIVLDNQPDHAVRATAPAHGRRLRVASILAASAVALLTVGWVSGLFISSDRRFGARLHTYSNSSTLYGDELAAACEALEQLPHDGAYEHAEAELIHTWLKRANLTTRKSPESTPTEGLEFLRQQASLDRARGLRQAVVLVIAQQALRELSDDRPTHAMDQLAQLDQYLHDVPADGVPELRRIVWLGLARVTARRDPQNREHLVRALQRLPELHDPAKPDLTRFAPRERAATLAMLALAARAHGYKQVLPPLAKLLTPNDLRRYLTTWESEQVAALLDETRGQIEAVPELVEPWRSMANSVWPETELKAGNPLPNLAN